MPCTVVVYESPHRVVKLLTQLVELDAGKRPIAVSREISKLHEETLRGTISDVLDALLQRDPRGEYVVVLGEADQNTTL